MSRHITNAVYGVLDYVSYPLGMLAAAPVILHKLGAAEYGLWMVATSVVSVGGIIATGFSDAGIQRIAKLRGKNESASMMHAIRTLFAVNLVLGCVAALAVWLAAPYAASRIAVPQQLPLPECLVCLRIASIMILIRSIEAISVTTQRAFQDYRGTVRISTAVRLLTLACAIGIALIGGRMQSIMVATAILFTFGTILQFWHLRNFIAIAALWPVFWGSETRALLAPGVFVWLQVLGGVLFRQLDRILLGLSLGALAVAPYALCIQFAEPLFGLTASGLSFFFPYLSGRAGTLSAQALKRTVLKAFLCNALIVSCGSAVLLLFGPRFLRLWAGPAVAQSAASILPLVIVGSALSGLSVTGTYAVQALGLFRITAYISLGSRSGLLFLMLYLLHHRGLQGLAIARVLYGAATLLVYLPLIRHLVLFGKTRHTLAFTPVPTELQGEVRS